MLQERAEQPSRPAERSSSPERHWRGLDGLRGAAVAVVVLFHVGVARGGYLGVDIFFVLSGFLITRLLVAEQLRTGTVRLRRFYLRRVLRLYPALVALVAFVVLAAVLAGQRTGEVARDGAVALLYLSNVVPGTSGLLDHTWTLALEEQFYLCWPALLLLAARLRGRWRLAPALALLVALLVADVATGGAGALHTYVRGMGLPLGCAVALLDERRLRALGRFALPALVGLAVLVVRPGPAALTTGWPVSLGAVLAAPVVARLVTRPVRWAAARPLVWLGERSYSLYLWHLPLILLIGFHLPGELPPSARAVVAVLASLVAAECSYRWVEQPVLRWRDRRWRGVPAIAAPARSQPVG